MKQTVSILIPAYNSEKWIGQTIESALAQSWSNKEIIIVNDGSRDKTLERALRYESKFVKVINQENQGACAARNKALSLAQGYYIQWLDADDLLAPDKISQQMRAIKGDDKRDTLLASAFGEFYFRPENATFESNDLWQDLQPVEWLLTKFTHNMWMNPAVWLVSRKLTESAGPWDERLSLDDDGEYFCRVVAASNKVKFVENAKSYYRRGIDGSLSVTLSDKALQSICLSTKLSIEHLLSLENNKKTRAACLMLLENRLWYFHPEKSELMEQFQDLARGLGGNGLHLRETWKYLLFGKYFGWKTAKNVRHLVSTVSTVARKSMDRMF